MKTNSLFRLGSFIMVLSLVAMALIMPYSASAITGPTLSIVPAGQNACPGGTVTIDVWVDATGYSLCGIEFDVCFDDTVMTPDMVHTTQNNSLGAGSVSVGPNLSSSGDMITYATGQAKTNPQADVNRSALTIVFNINPTAPSGTTTDVTICRYILKDQNKIVISPVRILDGSVTVSSTWYADADGDGFGNPAVSTTTCPPPAGYVANNTDCDDGKSAVHPGAEESCDGIDNNCNGQKDEGFTDTDADGLADCVDPDDDNDGVNDSTDCAPLDNTKWQLLLGYVDADRDEYGAKDATQENVCSGTMLPAGYSVNNDDCADTNANINPGATEICGDTIDQDCNGSDLVCPPTYDLDWGDAPDSAAAPGYPTLNTNSGANHGIVSGFMLGVQIDGEADGQPTANADGDDLNPAADPAAGRDDEDGVVFVTNPLVVGQRAQIDVSLTNAAGGPAFLDAWIDWNADGDWIDSGEQIFNAQPLPNSLPVVNSFIINVPADAAKQLTFSRFRLSSTGGLPPTGGAQDGEVEDYPTYPTPEIATGMLVLLGLAGMAGLVWFRRKQVGAER
ncbi:MAG: MopE-related protein [Dehalococcoidia bacterium]|nr:MopE-related protein [Dehalococcoidia bacterium]